MLQKKDPEVYNIIKNEETRQQSKLSLIPSENFFSPAVREAVGSVFSHKYSEGNIGGRYYEGNENVDNLEQLAIDRAKKLFKLPSDWGVNVQALSGSSANLAIYLALLEMDETMMAMYLPDGGHLSHGWSFEPDKEKRVEAVDSGSLEYLGGTRKVNITSRMFNVVQYKTDPESKMFNYDEMEKIAVKHKPQLIITGGTAYPRDINYSRVREIADKVGANYLADIAHEAGLIAGGALPSPVGIADVVSMTTHKTLRAGRGAVILARDELIMKINRAVLPGLQGGPHNHNIAGICVGLGEALQPQFPEYVEKVVENSKLLGVELVNRGFKVVSGGTDKHLLLIDLTDNKILGRKFARALDIAGIVANANSMPQEKRGPADPSALRIGTPWVTTRGMRANEMKKIADWIEKVMVISSKWADLQFEEFEQRAGASAELKDIAREVAKVCNKFPLLMRNEEKMSAEAFV